ncbi:hypothetical protein [Tsukamurella tyrosinosolvens]|uniref:hypothetical protein n=1 Tax=Tsukamurella tyrosinosolvens TaxID=57704 RepID=UPI003F4A0770
MTEQAPTTETTDPTAPEGEQTAPETPTTEQEQQPEGDTFPRAYVEQLRRESAGYRERAQNADALAARLHTALVAATGRLADPSDLAFDAAHLDDEAALAAAVDELLTRKPHLAARRVTGDVGAGTRGQTVPEVSLLDLARGRI